MSGLGCGDAKGELDCEDEVPARGRVRPGPDPKEEGGAFVGVDVDAPASSPPPVKPLILAKSPSEMSVDAL